MRAYFLTNMYLSSIQNGIQALHCLQEINNNYTNNHMLHDWAVNHKTTFVLNGGTSQQMTNILKLFDHGSNPYPWSYFREESLEDTLTCVGIIVPVSIYGTRRSDYGSFDHELSELLTSKRFAK